MSDTVEIAEGYYALQLASTAPVRFTGLYAAGSGIGNQILLKKLENVISELWFISPVETEPNTYLITKHMPSPNTSGFMPDTNFDKVVLDVPSAKWSFNPVREGPGVPPNVYFIRPVDHPERLGVDFYLGPDSDTKAVVIDTVPVIANPPPAPAWELIQVVIDAK